MRQDQEMRLLDVEFHACSHQATKRTAEDKRYPDRQVGKMGGFARTDIYHCRSGLKPFGCITAGLLSVSGVHGCLSMLMSCSSLSLLSLMKTCPGADDEKRKWCSFLIPGIFLKSVAKKSVQSSVGTTVVPSSRDTSWATLHSAEMLTTSAMFFKLPMFFKELALKETKTPVR